MGVNYLLPTLQFDAVTTFSRLNEFSYRAKCSVVIKNSQVRNTIGNNIGAAGIYIAHYWLISLCPKSLIFASSNYKERRKFLDITKIVAARSIGLVQPKGIAGCGCTAQWPI